MSRSKTQVSKQASKNVSANEVMAELASLVKKLTALVGKPSALTAADMKRSLKLRKGGAEKVIPIVAALSDQFGLSIAAHPTDAMVAKAKQAESLVPLHRGLVKATKHVADALFLAQSESWQSATVHYSTLRRLAKQDGDVAKALAPATQFFAQKNPVVVKAENAKRGHRKGTKTPKAPSHTADVAAPGTTESTTHAAPVAEPTPTAAPPQAPSNAPRA